MANQTPLDGLIEALRIFKKYDNGGFPTHCEHDELSICCVEAETVNDEDKVKLEELGFFITDDGYFQSYRYGSA